LIDQAAELEKFWWYVRAYLENACGQLAKGATTEKAAARSATGAIRTSAGQAVAAPSRASSRTGRSASSSLRPNSTG
jgi:hypothetical protein